MIDYLKMRVEHIVFPLDRLTYLLGKCNIRNTRLGKAYDFRLDNLPPGTPHWLRLTLLPYGTIEISGSIRKWLFGANSLKDLTFLEFELALSRIAKMLGIDLNDLKKAVLKSFEIGFCIRMDYRIHNLALYFPRMEIRQHPHSVSFNEKSDRVKIKLYDKSNELAERRGVIAEDENKKAAFRLEVAVKKLSKVRRQYGNIETIGDLLKRWNYLSLKWFVAANRIEFGNLKRLNEEGLSEMSISEHKKFSLATRPIQEVFEEIKYLNAKAGNKSRYRKELIAYHNRFRSDESKVIVDLLHKEIRTLTVSNLMRTKTTNN